MADTAIDICSRALIAIGEAPIASFTSKTTAATVAGALYEPTVRQMLALERWKFSRRTQQLSRLVSPPDDGVWTSAYALPSDWLETQSVTIGGEPVPFEHFEATIRCDADAASVVVMKYVSRVPETHFPASFVAALEAELAARFAFPVTAQESLAATKRREANNVARQARGIQSQGETTQRLSLSRFKAARRG